MGEWGPAAGAGQGRSVAFRQKRFHRMNTSTIPVIPVLFLVILGFGQMLGAAGDPYAEPATAAFGRLAAKAGPPDEATLGDASGLAWGESYVLKSYVAMYEGTGKTSYLEELVRRGDRVLAFRDDRRKVQDVVRERVMPSWSTGKYSDGKRYAWIVHAGMITYPLARFAWLVKSRPELGKAFGAKAAAYEKDVIETVKAFDKYWKEGPGKGEGFYWGLVLGKALPLNQQNALGRTQVMLWLTTGQAVYKERAEKLARYFKNRMKLTEDRYTWAYWDQGGAEDISHAAINVDFAYLCYRGRLVFEKEDMARLARTLQHCGRGKEGFALTVDGQGETNYSMQAGRWGHLGFVSPEVRVLLFEYFKENWEKNTVGGMVAAAYLVETSRPFTFTEPIKGAVAGK